MNSSLELIQRLSTDADNDALWQRLLTLEHGRWFGIAWSILQNRSQADDAIQNALIFMHAHVAQFTATSQHAEASAQAWLVRIITNSALQLRRSETRLHKRGEDYGASMHATAEPDPAHISAESDLVRIINTEQQKLPIHHQQCLALYYGGELSYEECAQTLECSVAHARTRVNRALKALRKLLKQSGIACTIWAISNSLSAHDAPLHLSHVDISALHSAQHSGIANSALDATLSTGELSIMSKIGISSVLAAGICFTAFGINAATAEEQQPNPVSDNKIIKLEDVKVETEELSRKKDVLTVAYNIAWTHAPEQATADNISKEELELFKAFPSDKTDRYDEFLNILDEHLSETWSSRQYKLNLNKDSIVLTGKKDVHTEANRNLRLHRYFLSRSRQDEAVFKKTNIIPPLLYVKLKSTKSHRTIMYDIQYEQIDTDDFIDDLQEIDPDSWAEDHVFINVFNATMVVCQTPVMHKKTQNWINQLRKKKQKKTKK